MPLTEGDSGAHQLDDRSADSETVNLDAEIDRMREREEATRNVLEIISQSPSDTQPLFEVIAATSQRLRDPDAV